MRVKKIALLGVDGTGKSTMSIEIQSFLIEKGYNVKIIPFHKWVIADILRSLFGKIIDRDRDNRNSPYKPQKKSFSAFIKPPIAFLDNLLFLWLNTPRENKQIFIYDRYVCATQIKFAALGYSNNWFKQAWWSLKPDFAIVFDVDVGESVRRQHERNDPYAYPKEILEKERKMYLNYAQLHSFPVVKSVDIETARKDVLNEIVKILSLL